VLIGILGSENWIKFQVADELTEYKDRGADRTKRGEKVSKNVTDGVDRDDEAEDFNKKLIQKMLEVCTAAIALEV
jgi:hypothetical protein